MADVLLIAAEDDAERAFAIALDLERRGWSVAWDGGRGSRAEWTAGDAAALAASGCCVVLWSRASRYSRSVEAAALAAQRAGKLVGAGTGGTGPPYGLPAPDVDLDRPTAAGELAVLLQAVLAPGPGAYHLPVRRRLLAAVAARLGALRRDRVGRLWSAVEQLRRRRTAAGAGRVRESWWRRLVGR